MSEVLLFCLDKRLSMTFPTRVLFDSVINLRMTRDFGGVGFGVLGLEEGGLLTRSWSCKGRLGSQDGGNQGGHKGLHGL